VNLARAALALALATLAACNPADSDGGPEGATLGERRALDQAAEMIDQRRAPPDRAEEGDAEEAGAGPGEAEDGADGRE
jgi:hypothetical protein